MHIHIYRERERGVLGVYLCRKCSSLVLSDLLENSLEVKNRLKEKVFPLGTCVCTVFYADQSDFRIYKVKVDSIVICCSSILIKQVLP